MVDARYNKLIAQTAVVLAFIFAQALGAAHMQDDHHTEDETQCAVCFALSANDDADSLPTFRTVLPDFQILHERSNIVWESGFSIKRSFQRVRGPPSA
ncbi:MAG: hypothetical protein AAGD92_14480 [Pseudomonadota bacterium]